MRNVVSVSVEDEGDIGWDYVGHLMYDAGLSELRIVSNVPCEIVVRCHLLDVDLIRN